MILSARVENHYEQVGITTPISFTWKCDKKQKSFRLLVSQHKDINFENPVFDSNRLETNEMLYSIDNINITDFRKYIWKIISWDFSEKTSIFVGSFISGMNSTQNQLGKWITNNTNKPFYVRKKINCTKKISEAYGIISGLGQFNFYINGKKISDHILDPGWTDYKKIIQYVIFDIKDYLNFGENLLGFEVGNGWFHAETEERYFFKFPSFMPPNPNPYKPFSPYLMMCGEIHIIYEDGTQDIIYSDESFKTHEHYVEMSNVFGSEIINGKKIITNWNNPDFFDVDWENAKIVESKYVPSGTLIHQNQPPIYIKNMYQGKLISDNGAGELVFDFGQNMSGLFSAKVIGKSGSKVDMYPAEKLDLQGKPDQFAKNWMDINTYSTYIIGKDYEEELFCPVFSYACGRYLLIKGATSTIDNKNFPLIFEVKGYYITSKSEDCGFFSSDDLRFDQIYNIIHKSVEANLNSVHTDCPQIEKFAWQEPNHLMAPSIMYMKDVSQLWNKILTDLRFSQHVKGDEANSLSGSKISLPEGLIPSQAPCYILNVDPVPGMGSFYDIIPWGSTIILGTYWHYMYYGNLQIIKDNYNAGKKYIEYLLTRLNENGFINHGLGDWGNPKEGCLARENIETAFLYADLKTMLYFSNVIEKTEDGIFFQKRAEEICKNYNDKLLVKNPNNDLFCYRTFDHQDEIHLTQACQALPLYWGMVPPEKEASVIQSFQELMKTDQSFISGEVGLPYIIQTMNQNNMNPLIVKYITKREHPSYYAFIVEGETTLPEYWETNARSHCHDMMGHIAEWYFNGIAGIHLLKPGFEEIEIKPFMPDEMNIFECTYDSIKGKISIRGKRNIDGKPEFEVIVPETIKYKLIIK